MKSTTSKKSLKRSRNIMIKVSIAIVVLLLVGSIGIGAFLFNYAIVRKPPLSNDTANMRNQISITMAQSRIDGKAWMDENKMEKMQITAQDGVALTGYFLGSSEETKKLAILIHGHRSNLTMMGNYAKFYYEQGFNIFMADSRGHGESGGDYVGMGWLDRLDYLVWLDALIAKTGMDSQIILHGVSMGASAAMMIGGEENLPSQVKCIIEDCGYTSVYDEFLYQVKELFHLPSFPILNIGNLACRSLAGFSFEEASALEQVKKTKLPIFFIHGDADIYNPTEMVYELYGTAGGEKELWVVPGAEHGMAFYTMPEEYINRVESFYEKYIY